MAEPMAYSDDQLDFIHKLERLADYVGREADDDFRELIGEIQDEFNNLKRGAVREGLSKPGPLTVQDVLDLGGFMGEDFAKAQKGCEVFVSISHTEQAGNAPNN
jgi:hypothetical protein